MTLTRRSFLAGLITAPAIVHAGNIMAVRPVGDEILSLPGFGQQWADPVELSIDLLRKVMETMKGHNLHGFDIDRITAIQFVDGRVPPAFIDEGRRRFKVANPHYACVITPDMALRFL